MYLLSKMFPPPKFLLRPAVGLDISDRSVKFVELSRQGDSCSLKKYGELDIPPGMIEQGVIKKPEDLAKHLSLWRARVGDSLREVFVALPEEVAYVVRMTLPKVPDYELRQTIELQLDQYVPLSPDNVVFDFEKLNIIDKPGLQVVDILVTVFPLDESQKYYDVLTQAGFIPLAFEIEPQSLARVAKLDRDQETAMIVEIGRTRTGVEIVSKGVMALTSTVLVIGGNLLTEAVKKNLQVDLAEAEKLKVTHGLSRSSDNLEVFNALLPILSSLKDELSKLILFWQKKESASGYYNAPVNRVILCGGQVSLPGLVEYLSGQLHMPVEILNPWAHHCFSHSEEVPKMPFEESLRFSTAIGLALFGVDRKTKP